VINGIIQEGKENDWASFTGARSIFQSEGIDSDIAVSGLTDSRFQFHLHTPTPSHNIHQTLPELRSRDLPYLKGFGGGKGHLSAEPGLTRTSAGQPPNLTLFTSSG
jgi:hypothetical protein